MWREFNSDTSERRKGYVRGALTPFPFTPLRRKDRSINVRGAHVNPIFGPRHTSEGRTFLIYQGDTESCRKRKTGPQRRAGKFRRNRGDQSMADRQSNQWSVRRDTA